PLVELSARGVAHVELDLVTGIHLKRRRQRVVPAEGVRVPCDLVNRTTDHHRGGMYSRSLLGYKQGSVAELVLGRVQVRGEGGESGVDVAPLERVYDRLVLGQHLPQVARVPPGAETHHPHEAAQLAEDVADDG